MKKALSFILVALLLLTALTSCVYEQKGMEREKKSIQAPISFQEPTNEEPMDDLLIDKDAVIEEPLFILDYDEPAEMTPEPSEEIPQLTDLPPIINKESYYTVLGHDPTDYIGKSLNRDFVYDIFWDFEKYKASLAPTATPIADEKLFEDNIVIFLKYIQRYNKLTGVQSEAPGKVIGFYGFNYDYRTMKLKVKTFKGENTFNIAPVYIVIPKTDENGLAHHSKNNGVELIIENKDIANEYVVREQFVNDQVFDEDRFWLILNDEDYKEFYEETNYDLKENFYPSYYSPIKIVHYSPSRALNSEYQYYNNIHMHADGTLQMDYNRVFFGDRNEIASGKASYTVIDLYFDNIDFEISELNGELICERYDILERRPVIDNYTNESECYKFDYIVNAYVEHNYICDLIESKEEAIEDICE